MSRSFKIKFYSVLVMLILIVLTLLFFFLNYFGVFHPSLHLIGKQTIQIEVNTPYHEMGVKALSGFKDVSSLVQINNPVVTDKLGEYRVEYSYQQAIIERVVKVIDTTSPSVTLNGLSNQVVFQDEPYQELGVRASDNSKQEPKIEIKGKVDTNKLGQYSIEYRVSDSSDNQNSVTRLVEVVENPLNRKIIYAHDELDNTELNWWFHKASDHQRKAASLDESILEQYQAYYLGPDEKVIYLTFDEGGNDVTYIKEIANVLNNNDIQATFFLTRNYIANEADFMLELVKHGHEIGNHSVNHYKMNEYASASGIDTFVKEIMRTEKTIYEVTGMTPPKIFRFPSGTYSIRALALVHLLGYRTFFWSHAYYDYDQDVSSQMAFNNMITHLHPGAIYLLHPSNKGNYEAMEDFIKEAVHQGYRFDKVSNIESGE